MITFWPLLEAAFKDRRLNRSNLGVLSFLVSYYWTTGVAFPSIDYMGDRCGVSRNTVKRSLRRLESFGYIARDLRPGRSTSYLPGPVLEAQGGANKVAQGGANVGPRSRSSIPRTRRRPSTKQTTTRRPSRDEIQDHSSRTTDGQWAGGSDAFFDDDGRLKQ